MLKFLMKMVVFWSLLLITIGTSQVSAQSYGSGPGVSFPVNPVSPQINPVEIHQERPVNPVTITPISSVTANPTIVVQPTLRTTALPSMTPFLSNTATPVQVTPTRTPSVTTVDIPIQMSPVHLGQGGTNDKYEVVPNPSRIMGPGLTQVRTLPNTGDGSQQSSEWFIHLSLVVVIGIVLIVVALVI